MQHIRTGKTGTRKVRDEIYEIIANLKGFGLSTSEACLSVVVVANHLFDRKWKVHCEVKNQPDEDTLPAKSRIREAMEMIEAKSLSCIVNKVEDQAAAGRMVTHATDSTTKERVGKFAVSGIHIGRNGPFP